MTVVGLGPHGERASPPERILLLPSDIAAARQRDFRVAIVMHTLESDWAKQLVQGMIGTLGECGIAVVEVIDCNFSAQVQVDTLTRLSCEEIDAVISLPVTNSDVAEAHRNVSTLGKSLVLVDNAPTGLIPGTDYVSLVSADNFGLGKIAAKALSDHLPENGTVGLIGYDADFFATNQREIAFASWMEGNRPDLNVEIRRFTNIPQAGAAAGSLIDENKDIAGIFVVWDTPCANVIEELNRHGIQCPLATVDLGKEVAISLAVNGPVVAIAGQRPFQQGEAVARTTVTNLLGRACPDWVALSGLAISKINVVESYQTIWRMPAPREILSGLDLI